MDRIESLCVEKGMRMTEQRRVIARVLEASADHPDVEELYRRSSAVDARISISTVYRTVKLFEDAGIIGMSEGIQYCLEGYDRNYTAMPGCNRL